jgi:murein DD-endopeptidase MepM/ murein hydrolase activator NlpD
MILVLVMVSGITGALYFYLAPSFAAHFPFSCSIPTPPFSTNLDTSVCTLTDQPLACKEGHTNGCQEIAELTGQGETLFSLLKDNLTDESWARKVAASLASLIQEKWNKPFKADTVLDPGKRYAVAVDAEGHFLKATIELEPADVFHAVRKGDSVRSWKEELVVLDFKIESISFPMRGTLEQSVARAGEGSRLASELKAIFKWDIDFGEWKRGDVCKVLFQRRYADDRPSGYGDILCAVYEGKEIKKVAIQFHDNSSIKYYDANGVELRKIFLRSPLGARQLRITSNWGSRIHPITRIRKDHKGVDYGAPLGTPVLAVAAGVVTFAGWNGGYGNQVWVRHSNGRESRYGHLKKIDVRKGQHVEQGRRIGLVGMTGMATGPHLDFEILEGGRHVNPHARINKDLNPPTVAALLKSRFNLVKEQRLGSLGGLTPGRKSASAGPPGASTAALR